MPVQKAKDRQQEAFEAYLRTIRGSEEEKEALKEWKPQNWRNWKRPSSLTALHNVPSSEI